MQNPSRKVVGPEVGFYFPFGRSRSSNILEDFNLPSRSRDNTVLSNPIPSQVAATTTKKNCSKTFRKRKGKSLAKQSPIESETSTLPPPKPATKIKILLLRCSDLHKSLVTISALPSSGVKNLSLEFHTNNTCLSNVARNILILKIMLSDKFNCSDKGDMQYLWDVWFSVGWGENSKKRFIKDLGELTNDAFTPPPKTNISLNAISSLQKIWKGWITSVNDVTLNSAEFRSSFHYRRAQAIVKGWGMMHRKNADRNAPGFQQLWESELKDAYARIGDNMSIGNLSHDDQHKFVWDVGVNWVRNGISNLSGYNITEVCLNPTLLEPGFNDWRAHPFVNPLTDFLPIHLNDLVNQNTMEPRSRFPRKRSALGLMLFHSHKKLQDLVQELRNRKDQVEFFFYHYDPLELCFNDPIPSCDIVDCADLADEVGLANVLLTAERKLTPNPSSIVLTEVSRWMSLGSLTLYVEHFLCVPLSMVPTFYGFRLATPVQLGDSTPPDLRSHSISRSARSLTWNWTPPFRKIFLEDSTSLYDYIDRLKTACFPIFKDLSPYTPQTFNFILYGLARRTLNPAWITTFDFRPSHFFRLAWKTLSDWQKGRPVSTHYLRLSFEVIPIHKADSIRLLLFSEPLNLRNFNPQSDEFHIIDNVDLDYVDGKLNHVSFRLAVDHGLENKQQYAYLFDSFNGKLYTVLTLLDLEVPGELYPIPHPYSKLPDDMFASLPSCQETPTDYELSVLSRFQFDLDFVASARPPCRSTQSFVLRVEDIDVGNLTMPHTLLPDVSIRRVGPHDRLVTMTKSLYEPLQESFRWPGKWNPDGLNVCDLINISENNLHYGNLSFHLERQFSLGSVELRTTPLDGLRRLFSAIFHHSWSRFKHKQDVFVDIRYADPSVSNIANNRKQADWFLRIHFPMRFSPNGSPMLTLTALDQQMADNLKKNESDDFDIFILSRDKSVQSFCTRSPEESDLLRFALRYNSTRVRPSRWQEQYVPLGDDSPWLATFISPLYAGRPRSHADIWTEIQSVSKNCSECRERPPTKNDNCIYCNKKLYCSPVCRISHRTTHRRFCHHLNLY